MALAAYLLASWRGETRWLRRALVTGWGAHALALTAQVLGWGLPGDGARFGFAPALSIAVWLVLGGYVIESRFMPLPRVRRGLALLGSVTVLLALVFPGEPGVHPASPWAPLHWVLGLASYGLFGAAVLHATWLDRAERAMRKAGRQPGQMPVLPLLTLEKLTYRFVLAGFAVLSLALLLGVWFTPVWHWDHKTVFSVLGWAVFAGLLAGRRAFGWRGRRATRWLYIGTGLLLLAYVGSRFVFEVLLHRAPALAGL
ncbi:ABC-type uncharacterized transport system permease subunit [Sphaerotilus hippei]|uniref:ABC-type uncharacterized transport system permease subunit n=2 Tax=Sphaerotilus hippei TaxID=744406 RepID=A0A318H7X5_9BURK|nr:ABC-type uncharacterized transport system permease subunit [Sphaerotilus hippei]